MIRVTMHVTFVTLMGRANEKSVLIAHGRITTDRAGHTLEPCLADRQRVVNL